MQIQNSQRIYPAIFASMNCKVEEITSLLSQCMSPQKLPIFSTRPFSNALVPMTKN